MLFRSAQLTNELALLGARLMVRYLAAPQSHPAVLQPDEGVTYAAKIDKGEARIDWSRTAEDIERQVRAFAPSPGAWFEAAGERIKLLGAEIVGDSGPPGTVLDGQLTVAAGEAALRPTLVQRAGRGPMTPAELLRGFPIPQGAALA